MKIILLGLFLFAPLAFGANITAECANGTLFILSDGKSGNFTVEIRDPYAIEYFERESQSTGPASYGGSAIGLSAFVEKKFPENIYINTMGKRPVMRIYGLQRVSDNTFSTTEYGPMLRILKKGIELRVSASKEVKQNRQLYYDIGRWFFESCDLKY